MRGAENRKHKRIKVMLDVKIDQQDAFACIENVSIGGLCLLSEKKYAIDTILDLFFPLSQRTQSILFQKSVKALCVVVWNKQISEHYHAHGMKFIKMSKQDELVLLKYISERQREMEELKLLSS